MYCASGSPGLTDARTGYGSLVSAPEVHQEIERKLDVSARFRLPALPGSTALPHLVLTAIYYDTADLRLARHRITMRRRTGGGDDGWHVKLPHIGDDVTRDEVHLPLDTPGEPPGAFVDLVLGFTRGATLAPVATLRNERRPMALVDGDGRALAELTDDHVAVIRDGKVVARFREVEVEAAPGRTVADLEPIVSLLLAAGAREASFASKAVRALGPRAQRPPDVGNAPFVDAGSSAADVLRAHLVQQVAALQWHDLGVRRGVPDSVHQMRVAIRHLRSTLRVFETLFVEPWAKALRDDLGVLAGRLSPARDAEVQHQRLHDAVRGRGADAARRAIDRTFARRAATLQDGLTEALRSVEYLALLDHLVAAAAKPRFTRTASGPAADVLTDPVAEAWRQLAEAVDDLHRKGPDAPWHRARILAKRVRYATEAVAPACGDDATRFAKRLSKVTELLGRHQDASMTGEAAAALANHPRLDPDAARAFRRVHKAARVEVRATREKFLGRWPKLAHTRHRRWLRQRTSR